MAGEVRDPASRIEALLAAVEPQVRERFLLAIAQMRSPQTLRRVAGLAARGDLQGALDLAQASAKRVASVARAAFVTAGEATTEFIGGKLGVIFDFDAVNERAVQALRNDALRLVQEFTREQMGATQLALEDGMKRGLNPRATARAFRDSIGLTRNQQQSVLNFRRALEEAPAKALSRQLRDRRFDGTVRAAAEGRKALSPAQVDQMVTRYSERFVAYRAEVVARTESLGAVHAGAEEAYRQAVDDGLLTEVRQTWTPARDGRTRDSHVLMAGQERPLGEPFLSGLGNLLRYPGDSDAPPEDVVQCRCALATRSSLGPAAGKPVPDAGAESVAAETTRAATRARTAAPAERGVRRVGGIRWSTYKKPGERLIEVDVARLDRAWSKEKGYYIPKGGGGAEIGGRRENFRQFLRSGTPVEAPKISVTGPGNRFTGSASFEDGRHRFSVLRDQGVKRVLVRVPAEEAGSALVLLGGRGKIREPRRPAKPKRKPRTPLPPNAGLPTVPRKPST